MQDTVHHGKTRATTPSPQSQLTLSLSDTELHAIDRIVTVYALDIMNVFDKSPHLDLPNGFADRPSYKLMELENALDA